MHATATAPAPPSDGRGGGGGVGGSAMMSSRTVTGAPAPRIKRSPYLYSMTSSRDAGPSTPTGGGLKRTKRRPNDVTTTGQDNNPPKDFFELKRPQARPPGKSVLRHHGDAHAHHQGGQQHVAFGHKSSSQISPTKTTTTTDPITGEQTTLTSSRSVSFHPSVNDLQSSHGHASVAVMGGGANAAMGGANAQMGVPPQAQVRSFSTSNAKYKYEHSVGSLKQFLDEDAPGPDPLNRDRNQQWKTVTPDGVDQSMFGAAGMLGSKSVGNLHHAATGRAARPFPQSLANQPGAAEVRQKMIRSMTVAGGGMRSAGLAYGSAHFKQDGQKAGWAFPAAGGGGGGGNAEWTSPSGMLAAAKQRQAMQQHMQAGGLRAMQHMQTIGSQSSMHSTGGGMGARKVSQMSNASSSSQASLQEIADSMKINANSAGMAVASATRGPNALELKVKEMEERERRKKEARDKDVASATEGLSAMGVGDMEERVTKAGRAGAEVEEMSR